MAAPSYGGTSPGIYPGSSNDVLVTRVEIHVSCSKLSDKDLLSKSDPMVVMFTEIRDQHNKRWKEFDRTETVKDSLNPSFVKSFVIDYHFEELQKLKFEVYDSDSKSAKLDEHDFLGKLEVTLGSIVGEYAGKVTKQLLGRKDEKLNSSITFVAEELNNNKEVVNLQFKGRKLDKKDFFGSSDPYLTFYRHGIEGENYVPVHKTEVIKNNLNPCWKLFSISVTTLCNGDKHRPIQVECFDWDSDGSHDLIGEFQTTLHELLGDSVKSYELINKKKKAKKKSYKNSGFIELCRIELKNEPSFLDYITGGIELCFHVAIDFTASNGNPLQPTSLHFMDNNAPNQYVQALMSVGKICEDYDSDKLIPAYGFGARIQNQVYHDFHLNQSNNATCYGVAGVLDAYHKFLPTAELYGPTNFSPIINRVARDARDQQIIEKYHVLLILTDGVISDMHQTIDAVINASRVPMSIIIVGVGSAEFDAMDQLDSDNGMLSNGATVAERDIVQFVPYRNFSGSFASDNLAKEVLFEVPRQLVSFMTQKGIKPRPGQRSGLIHTAQQVVTMPGQPYPQQGSAPPYPTANSTTGGQPPYPTGSQPPYPTGGQPPYPTQGGALPYPVTGMSNMNINTSQKRQAPFAPGQEPKQLSAKEAALITLSK